MHATSALEEADRLMTVCNSCRYCEGLCAVFPAMEMRRSFLDGDLRYLSNLCHACGACYIDCQYAPPHEFNVNVPQTLAKTRNESYAAYAWPSAFSRMFVRNGLATSVVAALSVAIFIVGFVAANDSSVLFSAAASDESFYRLMPHGAMALLFGGAFAYAVIAMVMSFRQFWRSSIQSSPARAAPSSIWQAIRDAGKLRYLDGGGDGCFNKDDSHTDRRRIYHHLTFYGFLLCFAATCVGTLYHYVLHREAPYPWYDLPVLLGAAGGVGLTIGSIGLLQAKATRDPILDDLPRRGMDIAFLAMLLATGASGMALLFLRETQGMGLLLALHLGFVFSLFITMPYGKFVHGLYRFGALVIYASERSS